MQFFPELQLTSLGQALPAFGETLIDLVVGYLQWNRDVAIRGQELRQYD